MWESKGKTKALSGRACDSWNLYKEDIALMKEIGLTSYRFSVEWSKIEPKRGANLAKIKGSY